MTQKISLPTRYAGSGWMRPPMVRSSPFPFIPSLGFPAFLCGALGIAAVLAPEWIEGYIPHFRERYLPIVSLVIVFALLSSLWRLIKATVGALFFGVAALGLLYSFSSFSGGMLRTIPLPNFMRPSHYSEYTHPTRQSGPDTLSPTRSVNTILPKSKLPPALPDEAYFPRPKTQTEGFSFERVPGGKTIVQSIKEFIRE